MEMRFRQVFLWEEERKNIDEFGFLSVLKRTVFKIGKAIDREYVIISQIGKQRKRPFD